MTPLSVACNLSSPFWAHHLSHQSASDLRLTAITWEPRSTVAISLLPCPSWFSPSSLLHWKFRPSSTALWKQRLWIVTRLASCVAILIGCFQCVQVTLEGSQAPCCSFARVAMLLRYLSLLGVPSSCSCGPLPIALQELYPSSLRVAIWLGYTQMHPLRTVNWGLDGSSFPHLANRRVAPVLCPLRSWIVGSSGLSKSFQVRVWQVWWCLYFIVIFLNKLNAFGSSTMRLRLLPLFEARHVSLMYTC